MKIAKKSSSSADVQLTRGTVESFRFQHEKEYLGLGRGNPSGRASSKDMNAGAWDVGSSFPGKQNMAAKITHFKTALDEKERKVPPKARATGASHSGFLRNEAKLPPPVDKISSIPQTEKNKKGFN